MNGDDFDKVFGAARPNFAARVGREPAAANGAAAAEQLAGSGAYKPYGFLPAGGMGETCDVQRWLEETEVAEGIEFQYRFLLQIGYVGEEQIKLFLPDCIVVIDGKHLRDLRKKLARRQATFIQQFSPKVWREPPPAHEPMIERIAIVRPASDGKLV